MYAFFFQLVTIDFEVCNRMRPYRPSRKVLLAYALTRCHLFLWSIVIVVEMSSSTCEVVNRERSLNSAMTA